MASQSERPKETAIHDEAHLRGRAEDAVGKDTSDLASVIPDEIPKLLHELRVHHVELQMQNEELRQAQNSLAESCDHYTQLYDFSPAAYVTLTPHGLIEEANLRFCSLIGVHRKAVLQQPLRAFVLPQDWDILARHLADVAALETTQVCKLRLVPRDGLPLVMHVESLGVKDREGRDVKTQTAMLDITERERAESLVQESQRQVQWAAAKLLNAQEDERRRIARDLHDDHCQRLTAAILEISMLLKRHSAPWASPAEYLLPVKAKLSGLLKDLRDLSHELHPDQMASVALDEALHSLLTDFTEKTQIAATLHTSTRPVYLKAAVSNCLYRVIQECLTNIRKHAKAKRVNVSLMKLPHAVELLIKDDGQGFVPEAVEGSHHLGLTSMRERVKQLQGTLTVTSRPRHGTTTAIHIPLPPASDDHKSSVATSTDETLYPAPPQATARREPY